MNYQRVDLLNQGDRVTLVEKGDYLGGLLPPTVGQPGKDVLGYKIKAPDPINVEVLTNPGIKAEADVDGSIAFNVTSEGGIYLTSQIRKIKDEVYRRINIGVYPVVNTSESSLDL